ncbi:MAG: glycosyltransferase family 2 protein [Deferribacteraceae bacterium]|jgi:glycosyltransferase involved in cell wall biosynthesis|nr:glycosyltransferase family 2 protein [Deferribacteraceae bacterium]
MKLIIQIPCYNEEKTLGQTFADLPKHIDGVDTIEYLIINDGSRDNTVKVARELGIHHIVNFKNNKGLARGFMAGIDACLRLGADIVVNTDADNQYCGADIKKLINPILENRADIVIGERAINDTEHFSWKKKKLQRLGSWIVRLASTTDIPDAPSGFRAYSRDAALRLNVINEYTYTLETIIQAGRNRMALMSVQIRTNPETRESRLFKSMWTYVGRSASVIIRSFMIYKPLMFFGIIGSILIAFGLIFVIRFLVLFLAKEGMGHIQSLVVAGMLVMVGVQFVITGLQADIIAANKKILEDIQYRVRKSEYERK